MPPTIVGALQFHSSTQKIYVLVCPKKLDMALVMFCPSKAKAHVASSGFREI